MVSQRHCRHALRARLDRRIAAPRWATEPLPDRHPNVARLSAAHPLPEPRGDKHREVGNDPWESRTSASTGFRWYRGGRSTISRGSWSGSWLAIFLNIPYEYGLDGSRRAGWP